MSGKKITEMFAFVVDEPDGGQGIPAITHRTHGTMPLIGADMERINSLRELAINQARLGGRKLYLMRFRVDKVEPIDIGES